MRVVILVCMDGPLEGQRFAYPAQPPATFGVARSVQGMGLALVPAFSRSPRPLRVAGSYVTAVRNDDPPHEHRYAFVDTTAG